MTLLRYATVCSGIGAPECAFRDLGWQLQFSAEIEKFPNAVHAHHFPDCPNLGDITKFKNWPNYAIDLLVGGTPCQSFSVAGLRKGLVDPRGNLALTFLAIVERYRPQWLVWENVPGVHSSWSDAENRGATEAAGETESIVRQLALEAGIDGETIGRLGAFEEVEQASDFDCFLAGLAELGYGIASRVYDAQYFHVPQRRERVFVVGCAGGQWQRAAAVLFERESLCGHPPPRRQTGEGVAGPIAGCSNGGGANGPGRTADDADSLIARPLLGKGNSSHEESKQTYIAAIPIQEIGKRQSGTPENGSGYGKSGDPMFTLQSSAQHGICATLTKNYATHHGRTAGNNGGVAENQLIPEVAHSLNADGFDASEDGTGRGTPLVAGALQERDHKGPDTETKPGHLIVFTHKDFGGDAGEISPTLRAMGHDKSHANDGSQVAIAFQPRIARNGRGDMGDLVNALNAESGTTGKGDAAPCVAFQSSQSGVREVDAHATLDSNNGSRRHNGVVQGYAVRRLTPTECERLQGFPDGWTNITFRGKPAADGPRYKALGNSMAVPNLKWIGQRIALIDKLKPL